MAVVIFLLLAALGPEAFHPLPWAVYGAALLLAFSFSVRRMIPWAERW